MQNTRKVLLQEKRIKILEEQLKKEKDLNKVIEQENVSLKDKIKRMGLLQQQTQDIFDEYKKEVTKLKVKQKEYSELIKEVQKERKQYKSKMQKLLVGINKYS